MMVFFMVPKVNLQKLWSYLFPYPRDAMEIAEEAEKEILKAAPNIIHVSIQLRLGRPMPQLNHEQQGEWPRVKGRICNLYI